MNNPAYIFKTDPYAHQKKALDISCDSKEFALFMEMGTGKSKVLIDNITHLYIQNKLNGVLIVAPKGVYRNWVEREIPYHLPDFIDVNMLLWTPHVTKQVQKEKEDLLNETVSKLKILVMNVEALSTPKGAKFAYSFLSKYKTLMAVDESTTIKNPTAKRTKNIIGLSKHTLFEQDMRYLPLGLQEEELSKK